MLLTSNAFVHECPFTDGDGQSSGRAVRQLPSPRFLYRYNGNGYV